MPKREIITCYKCGRVIKKNAVQVKVVRRIMLAGLVRELEGESEKIENHLRIDEDYVHQKCLGSLRIRIDEDYVHQKCLGSLRKAVGFELVQVMEENDVETEEEFEENTEIKK